MKTIIVKGRDEDFRLNYCEELLGKDCDQLFGMYRNVSLANLDVNHGLVCHLYVNGDEEGAYYEAVIFEKGVEIGFSDPIYEVINTEYDLVDLLSGHVLEF